MYFWHKVFTFLLEMGENNLSIFFPFFLRLCLVIGKFFFFFKKKGLEK